MPTIYQWRLCAFISIILFSGCIETNQSFKTLELEKTQILKDLANRSDLSKTLKNSKTDTLSLESVSGSVYEYFQNPTETIAIDSVLNTELNIGYSDQYIWNVNQSKMLKVRLRNYNGLLVPPTFRIKPGDLLRVKLNNNLPVLTDNVSCDPFGHKHGDFADSCNQKNPATFNTTNLHTHGLHVSPKDSSDNVLVHIAPTCDFQNHILLPDNHPQGTFWYHAHVHGSTAVQVSSGMAGAIIIEGGLDTLAEIKAAEEKIFVLQQIPYTYDSANNVYSVEDFDASFGPGTWAKGVEENGWRTTINGQTYPIIQMKSGEVQRWRFIHAGVRESLELQLEGHTMHEIALDGISLGRMESKDSIQMEPGYRSDVLVKANLVSESDTVFLIDREAPKDASLLQEYESPKVLAIVIISPEVNDMPLPTSNQLKPYAPFKSISSNELEPPIQKVWFNIDINSSPTCFTVNDQPFSMDNPPRKLLLNSANEWIVTSNFVNHPFHIHVNSFEIFKIKKANGTIQEFDPPIWKDTYLIMQNDSVHMRSRYENFDGEFVLHCHILDHEDQGMMELVKIVKSEDVLSSINQKELLTSGIAFCGPTQ
ncbi:multicopper oxidase family protein [Reichenbachiella versicolor]|uniref:multicopper oxidase family protein n=1 Tax=Reichenbachiella versicolor TaxID=1821036 RepID=UPI000D6DF81F|nr:multicopper oxidase family protein [Reichenbachiella versicolor]